MNNVISLHLTNEFIDTQLVSSRDDKSNRLYVELVSDEDYNAFVRVDETTYPITELTESHEFFNSLWSGEGIFLFYVGSDIHEEIEYSVIKVENSMYNVQIQTIDDTHFKLVANTDTATRLNDFYSTTKEVEFKIDHAAAEVISTVNAEMDRVANYLQEQIDGNIQTYTGSYIPTLENEPAVSWETEADKNKHLGDIYLVNDQGGDQAGFAYRFDKSQYDQTTVVYGWVLIKDSDISKAIADSSAALMKANETGERLDTNYYNKSETNSQIQQTADAITQNVSANYATKQSVTDLSNNVTTNYSTTLEMNSAIQQKADEINQSVSSIYATKNSVSALSGEVTELEEQVTTNTSNITQNASNIELCVKEVDYTGAEIASRINQSADSVVIEADHISLAGKTIDLTGDNVVISSTNFSVTKNGNVTAKNISITGGDIILNGSSKQTNKITVKMSDNSNYSVISPGRIGLVGTGAIYVYSGTNSTSDANGCFITKDMVGVGPISINSSGDTFGAYHFMNKDGFDGYELATDAINNSIALRNHVGYLYANFFNAQQMPAQNMGNFTVTGAVFRSSDGFLRSGSRLSFATWLTGQNISRPEYIVGLTNNYGSFGYSSIDQIRSVLFPNNTWVNIGDDVKIGDRNAAGSLCIQGISGETAIYFVSNNGAYASTIRFNNARSLFIGRHHTEDIGFFGSRGIMYNAAGNGYTSLNASAFNTVSSKLIKTNIVSITEEKANALLKLEPVTFDFVNGEKNKQGLIAEDAYKVLPEIVSIPEGYNIDDDEGNAKRLKKDFTTAIPSIDYSSIIPYLIKLAQIQNNRINELEKLVDKLIKGGLNNG